ncbi:helix-turn-helix domain-containing protein [Roseibacillus ishigakijimensis]|uniref:HTH cro/C1-type domain-containing protein n=1 Tax=Roseibacillus ishigakijimensis TaxID=454146 RepID=A0A934RTJ2_9BACT|nr:hypothetical protein [Roseibacillus ishigakijimensis]MBK1835376.1 hypothetical protein [Roseibacillus ishigakijimensis]
MTTATLQAPAFSDLPTDYLGLCQLLMPRPIHDDATYWNASEMVRALAIAGEEKLTPDQADYLLILSDLIERYDQENLPPLKPQKPHEFIASHLDNIGMSVAEWGRLIGVDRSTASRLARGERPLTLKHVKATAQSLHLPLETLV